MKKIKAQYLDLEKALKKLKQATKLSETEINRDATIQRFEFTFELAWKLLGSILRMNKIEVYGPKNIFREAVRLNLISDPVAWFKFLESRNLTVHTYQEKVATAVYKGTKEFPKYVEELLNSAKDYF